MLYIIFLFYSNKRFKKCCCLKKKNIDSDLTKKQAASSKKKLNRSVCGDRRTGKIDQFFWARFTSKQLEKPRKKDRFFLLSPTSSLTVRTTKW